MSALPVEEAGPGALQHAPVHLPLAGAGRSSPPPPRRRRSRPTRSSAAPAPAARARGRRSSRGLGTQPTLLLLWLKETRLSLLFSPLFEEFHFAKSHIPRC